MKTFVLSIFLVLVILLTARRVDSLTHEETAANQMCETLLGTACESAVACQANGCDQLRCLNGLCKHRAVEVVVLP